MGSNLNRRLLGILVANLFLIASILLPPFVEGASPQPSTVSAAQGVLENCIFMIRAASKPTRWSDLSDLHSTSANDSLRAKPETLNMMARIAPISLRDFYDQIGLHFNWANRPDRPPLKFDGFQNAGSALDEIRGRMKLRSRVDPLQPVMIFTDASPLRRQIPVPIGDKIPQLAKPHRAPIMSGRMFYYYLAKRMFPIAAPSDQNILSGRTLELLATEHDFAHLFGPLFVRPEMNDAMVEVGQAMVDLQKSIDELSNFAEKFRHKFDPEMRLRLDILKGDAQNQMNGIPYLWQRLFFAIESPYFVPPSVDFHELPFNLKDFTKFDELKAHLEKLSPIEWKILYTALNQALTEWALPVGGASADLRYFWFQSRVLPTPGSKPTKPYYDHGLLTLLSRVRYYLQHPRASTDTRAEDFAKLFVHLKMARGIGPEEWMREIIVKPVTILSTKIRNEIERLKNSPANTEFNPNVLLLPAVDFRSRIGEFILSAPWFDSTAIRRKFGFPY